MLSSDAVALFLKSRKANGRRPATLEFYARNLRYLTNSYPDLPTTPEQLEAIWADLLRRGHDGEAILVDGKTVAVAEATRHGCFRALRALYRWLQKRGHLLDNPMTKVDAPALHRVRQRTLDRPDVDNLLGADSLSLRDRTILTLILDSGVRSGEARSICGRDLRDGWVAVKGKTGERQVWVHEETMVQLRRLAMGPDEAVFRTIDGRPLTRNRLYRIVSHSLMTVDLASGGKHGAHLLRHTFGRHFIVAKGPLPALQQILGHQSISTTMIYADLAGVEVQSAHHEHSQLTTSATQRLRRVK